MDTIKLEFTIEQLQIINTCIVKAPVPYELTAPLIDNINKQLENQKK